ncbi:O-antigen ligase family protein [Myxococcota bacterium]|nr:O-antigen ligase family protein [Myxococcota bacterium]
MISTLFGLLFLLALAPYATVSPTARAWVMLPVGVIGLVTFARGLNRRAPEPELAMLSALGLVAALGAGAAMLPVDAAARLAAQGDLGALVNDVYALAGVDRAPLALDPHRGLLELAIPIQTFLLSLGVATALHRKGRAMQLAWALLLIGGAVVALALTHRLSGAEHIYWVSEVPSFSRAPFFAPFVNPNDGGFACAALACLAVGVAASRSEEQRAVAAVLAVVLLAGVRLSGSRGAMLAAAAGLITMGMLLGGARARLGGLIGLALAAIGVWIAGPEELGRALSEWLVPEALDDGMDTLTGRADIYADAAALAGEAPLWGLGPAGFDEGFRVYKSTPTFTDVAHAHNEPLQILIEHGALVTGLWALFVGLTAARVVRAASAPGHTRWVLAGYGGALAALFVSGFVDFPLRIGALEVLGALLLGAVLGLSAPEGPSRGDGRWRWPLVALGALSLGIALGAEVFAWAQKDSETSPWGSPAAAIARGDAVLAAAPKDKAAAAEAVRWYKLALARQPLQRATLQKLAPALEAAGDWEAGLHALTLATRVHPTLPWVHRDHARLLRRLGELEASRAAWRRALACDLPDGVEEELVQEALRGPGDAATIAGRVLPERADRLTTGAKILESEGHQDEAERLLRRAATLDPRYRAHLGRSLVRWGRAEEALSVIGDAPGCFATEARAQAWLSLGRFAESEGGFDEAMRLCGVRDKAARGRLRLGLAQARMSQGDPRGFSLMETLISEEPDRLALRRDLIQRAVAAGTPKLARSTLKWLVDNALATDEEIALWREVR